MPGRVLIVDDDRAFVRGLERALRGEGHDVSSGFSAADARAQIRAVEPDVVVLDWQLPDADGLELFDELLPSARAASFLMVTAYPAVDVAVKAIKRGAFDYIAKGSDLAQYLLAVERGAVFAQVRKRAAEVSQPGESHGLLGDSVAMTRLRARLTALVEADDTTVFIRGETGTGKGVIARAIHAASRRAYEPFVAVDCTTIPGTLWESELFGYEKGSFSGATGTKPGRVEEAGKGTLFLDEIGELDLPIQAKLLRLLEEREYTRVGSTRPRQLAARIITATNRDLARGVTEGRFRADLRYRLEVFVVEVPPLRDRGDDLFLLLGHFARARARVLGRSEPTLHPELVDALARYPFPGNVRELKNMVEQAMLLSHGDQLVLADFPVVEVHVRGERRGLSEDVAERVTELSPRLPEPGEPQAAPATREAARRQAAERERAAISDAIQATGGNVTAAAERLGMTRFQLHRRLKKYGLE